MSLFLIRTNFEFFFLTPWFKIEYFWHYIFNNLFKDKLIKVTNLCSLRFSNTPKLRTYKSKILVYILFKSVCFFWFFNSNSILFLYFWVQTITWHTVYAADPFKILVLLHAGSIWHSYAVPLLPQLHIARYDGRQSSTACWEMLWPEQSWDGDGDWDGHREGEGDWERAELWE